MGNYTTSFIVWNFSDKDMLIYREPEGDYFLLPPKEKAIIKYEPVEEGIVIRPDMLDDGRLSTAIFPNNCEFQVFYKGKEVLPE
ncbi:hypothetical protein [Chitinophaga sp.]|uniref:hypothetical protein n=1 Tax=Chitinophaga sp. TaxID=1869181 RepID=UPI0031E01E7F